MSPPSAYPATVIDVISFVLSLFLPCVCVFLGRTKMYLLRHFNLSVSGSCFLSHTPVTFFPNFVSGEATLAYPPWCENGKQAMLFLVLPCWVCEKNSSNVNAARFVFDKDASITVAYLLSVHYSLSQHTHGVF